MIALLEGIVSEKKPILATRTRAVISKLFSFALDRELVEANPCARLGSIMPEERELSVRPPCERRGERRHTMAIQ